MIITGIGSSKRSKKIGDNISRIFHKKLGRKEDWVPRGRTSGVRCSSLQKASVSRGDVLWVEVPQDVLYEYEGVNHRVGDTSQFRVREWIERVLMVLRKDRYEVRA